MTITRIKAPTLEEVQRTISALEREFNVSSAELQKPEVYTSIPEDVASDWLFALKQQKILIQTYWKSASGPQIRAADHDQRSYQECVAA
jgi:hypothetical protein